MKSNGFFDGVHFSAAKLYLEELGNFTEAREQLDEISEEGQTNPVVRRLRDKVQARERAFWQSALNRAEDMTREFPEYGPGRQYRAFVERKLKGIGN